MIGIFMQSMFSPAHLPLQFIDERIVLTFREASWLLCRLEPAELSKCRDEKKADQLGRSTADNPTHSLSTALCDKP